MGIIVIASMISQVFVRFRWASLCESGVKGIKNEISTLYLSHFSCLDVIIAMLWAAVPLQLAPSLSVLEL